MIGHLALAEGSPSTTLVLPADTLPADGDALLAELDRIRHTLVAEGRADVTKIALIGASDRPGHDLDYRFVQVVPGADPVFELRGSCGHSILASCAVALRERRLVPAGDARRVRVNVLNNGDSVECTVGPATGERASVGAVFRLRPPVPLSDLLLLGTPVTELPHRGGSMAVTVASMGNPYVFVGARDLGVHGTDALFADDPALYAVLSEIRRTAQAALGWRPGVFPKIAALLPLRPGQLAVRAISVPSWHPTLALTGAVCLAATARVPGTVPSRTAGGAARLLRVRTPGRWTTVEARVTDVGPAPALTDVRLHDTAVTHLGAVRLPAPAITRP
jgi:2-methylaconitate cis-trans-isomerase PrpF